MVGTKLWKSLKELVSFDQDIMSLEKEVDVAQKLIKQQAEAIPSCEELLAQKEAAYKNAQKAVDRSELQSQELADLSKIKRQALDGVKNNKEYDAIMSEIQRINEQQNALESTIVQAWATLESTQKAFDQEKISSQEKIETLKQQVEDKKTAHQNGKDKLEQLLEQRKALQGAIPAEWLEKYESMKYRVADPIVPMHDDCCSACFYTILHQDAAQMKKGNLMPCRNCYRLLYFQDEQPEVSE